MKPYYEERNITIYHGDCLEVMATLPSASIDAVITDPPYGTTACSWDSVIPFAPMWTELKRIAKPNAAIVLFGSQPFTSALVMSNPKMFRYEWIWEKPTGTGFLDANRRALRCHENLLIFALGQHTYNPQKWQGQPNHVTAKDPIRNTGSVYRGAYTRPQSDMSGWKYPRSVIQVAKYSTSETLHPTQKPVALLDYLIRTYTNAGDTVLDFTMGSGTTLRAAKDLGRYAIGIERELNYVEIAANRLSQEVLEIA